MTSATKTKLVNAFAAADPKAALQSTKIPRRELLADDVQLEILYCGVCHSDLHQARNEWGFSVYPIVPGHEIVGKVTAVGSAVKAFKVGDMAAVGTLLDSCGTCQDCQDDLEVYCDQNVGTYNAPDKHLGGTTYGGYSESIVVRDKYVLHMPEGLDPAGAAPLLCAGITTYSPLKHWGAGPGKKVGIVGLGGLGHMGVKFARALGAHVVLFTTSPSKVEDAKKLGAHEVVLSKNAEEMAKHKTSFDLIIDCVSAEHDLNAYLDLLKRDGTLTMVGAPEKPLPINVFNLLPKRRNFAGSATGGIKETQEMLDFCAKHNILAEVEMIEMSQVNEAFERLLKQDVKYRFVIDMQSLKTANITK
ncbi:MAG: alcohol dehydrogenase [Cyanobacteriota bacterium erpe_2018_sw_39hr_WHONDRS-SW48-000098_B_bin.30]|nr:alcohol dehydrogenase [Cyanobacteriota bacterium erpe_2018_sw_39hr_WHONDRS-SW48-000098_B_bin.30]